MRRIISARYPLSVRVFLTGASALAGILFASAFTFPRPAPSLASEAVAQADSPRVTQAVPAQPQRVTVRPGDTLSAISASSCGTPSDWSGIYAVNRSVLADPDVIEAGQVLRLSCTNPGYTRPAPPKAPVTPAPAVTPAPQALAPSASQPARPATTYTGSSSMQQCIIARESGGNPDVTNASGHYGLYQFSYSTWVGSGGNPADFGHASVAEQNQVFANAVAARGYSDWAPSDGC